MMLSPAKINIFLEIVGKDSASGYHFLHSLMVKIALSDVISYTKSNAPYIQYTGRFAGNISNDIVMRAINILRKHDSNIDCNYNFTIEKNIPHGSGLGGASSNAASVLKFLAPHIIEKEFVELGMKIGADVPFFLTSHHSSVVKGFGEKYMPFAMPSDLFYLIVKPDIVLSTKDVFSRFNVNFTKERDLVSFSDATSRKNDLLLPAMELQPQIGDIINQISNCDGVVKCDMTGSGSACFAIFNDFSLANIAQTRFKNLGYFTHVASSLG